MNAEAESQNHADNSEDRVREFYRTTVRRFYPSFRIEAKNENEFLSRIFAMLILAGSTGGILALLPQWTFRYWFEGALLGVALSIAATRPSKSFSLTFRIIVGVFFGVVLQAFTRLGLPFIGMAVMGLGIGAQMAESAPDMKVKMDTVLVTVLTALLGAWSVAKLGPWIRFYFPFEPAAAVQWGLLGIFFALGALPVHIALSRNRTLFRVKRIRRKLGNSYRIYIDRLLDKYIDMLRTEPDKSAEEEGLYPDRKSLLGEALLETAETSLAWQQTDRILEDISEDALKARESELQDRYENLKEPGLKREIEKVLKGIEESLTRREELKLKSERLKLLLFRIEMDAAGEVAGC